MAFCPTLSAQEIGVGTGAEQSVTFAFTETHTDASLKPRDENGKTYNDDLVYENEWSTEKYNRNDDLVEESENYEYGSKQVTVKMSNKEFIQALVDYEFITGPITGWSLKLVTSGEVPDVTRGEFYAVKSGLPPVDLSDIISTDDNGYANTVSEKWSSKTTYKNAEADPTVKETWAFSGKGITNFEIEFDFIDGYAELFGILNESWSIKSFGKGDGQYWQYTPSAAKFDNVSGTSRSVEGDQFVDEWDYEAVIKGSMSLASGKLFPNINLPYPDFEPNYDDDDYDEDD